MDEMYGGAKGRLFAERACRVLGYFEGTGEIPGRFTRCDATALPDGVDAALIDSCAEPRRSAASVLASA